MKQFTHCYICEDEYIVDEDVAVGYICGNCIDARKHRRTLFLFYALYIAVIVFSVVTAIRNYAK